MKNFRTLLFVAVASLIIAASSCQDKLDNTTFFTTSALTLAEQLELYPDTLSSYVEILQKTGNFNAFKSYGKYTCFAPSNEAVSKYIKDRWGVSKVSDLNTPEQIEALRQIVKFHTMASKRMTTSFIEGRLADTTFTGDYLTATYALGGGIQNVLINKNAKILSPDIDADNGVMHILDKVLDPFNDMLPVVMEKTGKYKIFVEAMRKTGYYDYFLKEYNSNGSRYFATIIAESDAVYALSNIHSFNDLANLISPGENNYTSDLNPLKRFVGYHAVGTFLYSSDLPDEGFLGTVLENNAIKILKEGSNLKINERKIGENKSWLTLITPESNNPTRNGVYHTVNKLMEIFVPPAQYMLFDPVSDQPEVQSKAIGNNSKVPSGSYQYMSWYPEDVTCRYLTNSSYTNLNRNIWDVGGFVWMEFITPVIPKGKYEFLVCANGGNNARGIFQIYWDGEPIGSVWDVRQKMSNFSATGDSVVMEAAGYRHGLAWITNAAGASQYDSQGAMRFIITKELLCPEQKRHTIRFETVKSGGVPLDYFEFIPVK